MNTENEAKNETNGTKFRIVKNRYTFDGKLDYDIYDSDGFQLINNITREYLSRYRKAVTEYEKTYESGIFKIKNISLYVFDDKTIKYNKNCHYSLWAKASLAEYRAFWDIFDNI